MVQRKAPDRPKSSTEQKKSHGRSERQPSSHLQPDTKIMRGTDLKKKLRKVNSTKCSDFDSFELPPMDIQFKKTSPCKKNSSTPIRSYMRPTRSSDDKKKRPRNSKYSNSSSAVKAQSIQSNLKQVKSSMKKRLVVTLCSKKNVNGATCSSTLKDSRFPAALELNHGATEAEGSSTIRVCPYTYCSLNGGHMREPLPPLQRFISARRNLLQTQKSLMVQRLFSFKNGPLQKEGKLIDEETIEENNCHEISNFEEKYNHEQCILDEVKHSMEIMPQTNEALDISFEDDYDYDVDQNSELSQYEMDDVMVNFLEYVEFDHDRTTALKDSEEDDEKKKSEIGTTDIKWEEKICLFPDKREFSESPDEHFSENTTNSYATIEAEEDSKSGLISQSIKDEVQKLPSEMMNESRLGYESESPEKEVPDASNKTGRNKLNVSATNFKGIDGISNPRWNIAKKGVTRKFDQVKEFNPRPLNFLPLEPDPEAERVDLRHQTMDERRNSDEWMIDYALQLAVTNLGPARKKKVALLVEAFETVLPLPMCEKPLRHGTSAFNHLSFIQACS
ncbi:uncharacterized protein LOC110037772 [Phalaenopsis equestris]|uniref:uncharacterized protein LOC110037772 n=1 Tax=Phalaenopsis equestris TaxID=78828 RepID=UPI0009E4776C|nr:uncharacterized protein LOC110037772 [Phalaenopsis equestris]